MKFKELRTGVCFAHGMDVYKKVEKHWASLDPKSPISWHEVNAVDCATGHLAYFEDDFKDFRIAR